MPVSPEDAVQTAQDFLDHYIPGAEVEDRADPFYGYYTLQILRDGNTVGMLSVNGYTRPMFIHTWRDDFVESVWRFWCQCPGARGCGPCLS